MGLDPPVIIFNGGHIILPANDLHIVGNFIADGSVKVLGKIFVLARTHQRVEHIAPYQNGLAVLLGNFCNTLDMGNKHLGNIADAVYVEKSIQLDALTEVKALTSDAAVIDYVMANYLVNKEGSDFADLEILDMGLSDDEFYGIAFRKGSDLTAKVNEILAELEADGTIAAIAEKYALNDALVSVAG